MKNKELINYLCLSGILSFIFYLLHDIIGSLHYPSYNWMSQAVSDLTATDAPSFIIANGYSKIYGIFSCLCCSLLCILIKNDKSKLLRIGIYAFTIMNYISAIGYSLFPLSSTGYDNTIQSFIHVYVITTLVVLLSIISLVLIAIGSLKKKDKHKMLGIMSIIFLSLMFIGTIGSSIVPKDYFGITWIVSVILCFFLGPIMGIITRFSEGKIVAGILRLFFGWNIVWLIDFLLILFTGKILRVVNF